MTYDEAVKAVKKVVCDTWLADNLSTPGLRDMQDRFETIVATAVLDAIGYRQMQNDLEVFTFLMARAAQAAPTIGDDPADPGTTWMTDGPRPGRYVHEDELKAAQERTEMLREELAEAAIKSANKLTVVNRECAVARTLADQAVPLVRHTADCYGNRNFESECDCGAFQVRQTYEARGWR